MNKTEENNKDRLFLETILENIPGMVFIKSAKDLRFTLFNKAGEDLLGFDRKDLIGKNDYDFFPPEQADFFTSKDRDVFKENRIVDIPEEPINTKYKGLRWLHTKKIPLFSQDGSPEYLLGISLDITERKIATDKIRQFNEILEQKVTERTKELQIAKEELLLVNEKLNSKNKDLIRINRDLDNFVYMASHDLKIPVSNIEGLVNMLDASLQEKKFIDPDIQNTIQLINNSVDRFQDTIKELGEIGRIQKNAVIDMEQLYVIDCINDVKLDLQNLIQSSEALIITDYIDCTYIQFSKGNLRSIVYNLLSNAIKYRSPDRKLKVEVKTYSKDDFCIIEVKDNGLGIKAGQIEKAFEMFKRLHAHVEGTGLGLYIVKRIVEDAGGKVEAESEEGKGSVFRIFIKNINPTSV
ncbi:MAG TPA: PAS domain-containing sensor histidine kinase [Cytophagaceae bacterium]|nr:PAS domain-containing sensor histidine kinase [Cytophagaceae bacterium]